MKNKIEHTQPSISSPKVGQFYRHKDGDTYLLSRVSSEAFCLVCLDDGCRWCNPGPLDTAFTNCPDEFTLITNPFTVTPQP